MDQFKVNMLSMPEDLRLVTIETSKIIWLKSIHTQSFVVHDT